MREFITYQNSARPHKDIDQRIPVSLTAPIDTGPVQYRNVLGGIIRDYYRETAAQISP